MICTKCKKEIKKESKFCPFCGGKITEAVEAPKTSIEKKIVVSKSAQNESNSKRGLTITPEASREMSRRVRKTDAMIQHTSQVGIKKDKDASVIGRGIAGGVIAGPAGAVVGALSAVDKNNKKKK